MPRLGPGTHNKMIYFDQKPIDERHLRGKEKSPSCPSLNITQEPHDINYREGAEDFCKYQVTGVPCICSALLLTVSMLWVITYDVLTSLPTCILLVHPSENSSRVTSSMRHLWTTDFFKTFSSEITILALCFFHSLALNYSIPGLNISFFLDFSLYFCKLLFICFLFETGPHFVTLAGLRLDK